MLTQTIFSGIGLGLTLAIMLGPAFFALLQTSIDKGFRSAFRLAVGICVSDALLIVIVLLGVSSFMEKPAIGYIIGLVGGGMLIGMGFHSLLLRYRGRVIKFETGINDTADETEKHTKKGIENHRKSKFDSLYLKGSLLNLANPSVWFFWIFSVSLVSSQYINPKGGPDIFYLTIFFACTLGTALFTDILKAFGAHRLKNKINEQFLRKTNMVFALIMIGFGVYLVAQSLYPVFGFVLRYYYCI